MAYVVTFYFMVMLPGAVEPLTYEEEMPLEQCIGTVSTFLLEARHAFHEGKYQAGCHFMVPKTEQN
jgi:hypothetical protein